MPSRGEMKKTRTKYTTISFGVLNIGEMRALKRTIAIPSLRSASPTRERERGSGERRGAVVRRGSKSREAKRILLPEK